MGALLFSGGCGKRGVTSPQTVLKRRLGRPRVRLIRVLGPEVGGTNFHSPKLLRFYVSFTLRLRTPQDDHATTNGTWCGAGFTMWVLLISGCPSLDHPPLDHPPLDHAPRPRGFRGTTPEKPNHALWVVDGLEPPPLFHEKTPRERTKFGNLAEEGRNSKFWASIQKHSLILEHILQFYNSTILEFYNSRAHSATLEFLNPGILAIVEHFWNQQFKNTFYISRTNSTNLEFYSSRSLQFWNTINLEHIPRLYNSGRHSTILQVCNSTVLEHILQFYNSSILQL